MPSRIIKESICSSDNLSRVSLELVAVWVHLLVAADDFGRMDARAEIIKGRCFPLRLKITNTDIEHWLEELQKAELLTRYEVEGRIYYQLSKWNKHNRLRAKASKYPAPPCLQMSATASVCKQIQTHANLHTRMPSYADSDFDSETDSDNNIKDVVIFSDQILSSQKLLMDWPQAFSEDLLAAVSQALATDGEAYVKANIAYTRQRASDNPCKYLKDSLAADYAGYRHQAEVRNQAAEDRMRCDTEERKRREREDEDARQWQASPQGQAERARLIAAGIPVVGPAP